MAEQIVRDLHESTNEVSMSKRRQHVALDASWEIAAISDALRKVVTPKDDQEYLVVRGFSMRLQQLSEVIMAAIGDEAQPTQELVDQVRGREMATED